MKYLVVEAEAEADIETSAAWYEDQQSGLGRRFIEELAGKFGDHQAPVSVANHAKT